jgi:hypothetical protein
LTLPRNAFFSSRSTLRPITRSCSSSTT